MDLSGVFSATLLFFFVAGTFVSDSLFADATWANQHVCSPFYRCLVRQDPEEQQTAWKDLCQGLESFTRCLASATSSAVYGPFYKGSSEPTIVDFTVFPWAFRLYILEHYRQMRLRTAAEVKGENENHWISSFLDWHDRMQNYEAVTATLAEKKDLLQSYARYERGTAKSLVGEAVRQGKEAHEI